MEDGDRRTRHHFAAVHRRARTQPVAAVADAARYFRARHVAGGAVRAGADRGGVFLHRFLARRVDRARAAAGAVVDRAGAADAAIGGPAAHPVPRARLFEPAVPGAVYRAAYQAPRTSEAHTVGKK